MILIKINLVLIINDETIMVIYLTNIRSISGYTWLTDNSIVLTAKKAVSSNM